MVVAKTQRRRAKCQMHKHLSTAVKESEHKVCQLGFLLFLNIFSVCSLPNFCLSCSLCQNPPTTTSNCQMLPVCQCLNPIPASPWSPSLCPHQEVLSSIFKLPECASSHPFLCCFWRFTKHCFPRQRWVHGPFRQNILRN